MKVQAFLFTLIAFAGLVAPRVHATSVPPPQRLELIEVKPAIAQPGVSRTITIKGTWPDSCVPTNYTLDAPYSEKLRKVIVQIVSLSESGQFCAAVFTPYTIEFAYTPKFAGVDNILVAVRNATLQGNVIVTREDRLFTGDPKLIRAADDISGLWYDPATNGSGLTMSHSFSTTDLVFGTWYVFDRGGFARWYTLQESTWTSDSVLEGAVYEARGAGCTTADACPVPVVGTPTQIGRYRMTFTNLKLSQQQFAGTRTAPTANVELILPTGAVAFTAKIARLPI